MDGLPGHGPKKVRLKTLKGPVARGGMSRYLDLELGIQASRILVLTFGIEASHEEALRFGAVTARGLVYGSERWLADP